MKLKKLAVRNLASIEEAEIDFAQGPIAGESLFLICGETGAGKTTLLDAVCLALYGKTPRFAGTRRAKKGEEAVEVEGFRADDVLQLVRRGTGEAMAELSFRGNDGHEYVARWFAEAYKKGPNKGRVKRGGRTWTDLTEHGRVFDKESDLRERSAVAIGLDFSQFLRTTMLAQGEFTRFLHADDDEKAEILEKLTDTSRFSALGAAIYARATEKKAVLASLDRELEGKKPLGAEEKASLEAEIAQLREENARDASAAVSAAARSSWLRRRAELEEAVREKASEAARARAERASAEVASAEKDTADWDASARAREALGKVRAAAAAEAEAAELLAAWRGEYAELLGARTALGARRAAAGEALEETEAVLERDAPMAETYRKSGEILAKLAQIRQCRADAEAAEKRRGTLAAELPALESALGEAKAAEGRAKVALEEKSREIEALEGDLGKRGEAEARARRDAAVERLADIGRARDAAATAADEEKAAAEALQKAGKARSAFKEEEARTEGLAAAADVALKALGAAEEALSAAEALVSDSVQVVVRHLHPGDECPICGGTIRALRDTGEYRKFCENARRRRDEARVAKDVADGAVAANAAQREAKGKLLETEEKNAQDAAGKREDATKALAEALEKASVGATGELSGAQAAAEAEKEGLEARLAECEGLRKRIGEARAEEKRRREEAEAAMIRAGNAQKALDGQKQDLKASETEEARALKAAGELLERVRPDVGVAEWEARWNAAPEEFETSLQREAAEHGERERKRDRLRGELREMDGEIRDSDETLEKIGTTVPEWIGAEAGEPREARRLAALLNGLLAKAAAAADRRERAKAEGLAAMEALVAERTEREDFTDARLEELSGLSGRIAELREFVGAAAEGVARAESALEAKRGDLAAHLEKRPDDLSEDDAPDALDARVAELRAAQSGREGQIGAIRQQLRDDERLVAERQDLLRRRGAAADESVRWEGLNAKLGDADGKKLRRILEAHVLRDVLRRSNAHLRRLAPRYELSCEGLTVTVFDADQAGAERPAKTLSGGEQFLVSLALALGLAGLDDRGFAVDMLFVDEGFGTLGGEGLEAAIATLQALGAASGGRKVGIISHVAALRERIPAHVEVRREGEGRSTVRVCGRGG